MIIADRKPIEELEAMLAPYKKVLLLGCKGCVTVCLAGGEKEVEILASTLRVARKAAGQEIEIKEQTIERQCDREYLAEVTDTLGDYEAVFSMACGAGVQFCAETYKGVPVYPVLNTNFIGVAEGAGQWTERCQACGNCVLDQTGGICPVARCSKSLFNGPCGGSGDGKCEIDNSVECGWQLIYDRLKDIGQLDKLKEVIQVKDWSTSRDGGPRKAVREELAE